jgi:protein gp37
MTENTKISWCDNTFNPWIGCAKISSGCKNCYAETLNKRYSWVDQWGPRGTRKKTSNATWAEVRSWNNKARWQGTRPKVFVGSLMDVFEDNIVLDPWREELFEMIEDLTYLEFLLLTKRPENISNMVPWEWTTRGGLSWPSNIWLGTTIENQEIVDTRIKHLISNPAAVYFLSVEPMLENIDISKWLSERQYKWWVICGGESGSGRRVMQEVWASNLLKQCREAHVPFFMKQLGGYPKKQDTLSDFPKRLQIREFPKM